MLSMLSMLNKAGERSPSEGQRCETACQQQGAAAVSSRVVALAQALKLTKYQPPIKAKLVDTERVFPAQHRHRRTSVCFHWETTSVE